MSGPNRRTNKNVLEEIERLKARLGAAEEALSAIRDGHVDAIVVPGPHGNQIFTLAGSDAAYRVFVERMKEGAVTVSSDATILYCNHAFAEILGQPLDHIIGKSIYEFVPRPERDRFDSVYRHPLDGPNKMNWKTVLQALEKDNYAHKLGLETHGDAAKRMEHAHASMEEMLHIVGNLS